MLNTPAFSDMIRIQIEIMSGISYETEAEMYGITVDDVRRFTRQLRDQFAENCTLVPGRYRNTVRVRPEFLRRVHNTLLDVKNSDAPYCREFFCCSEHRVFWHFLYNLHFYYGDSIFRCPDGYADNPGHLYLLGKPYCFPKSPISS